MNLCRGCRQDFGSVTAFDAHRVGKHAFLYDEDHPDGRRCLDTEELSALGWKQDQHGRWRTPASEKPFLRMGERLIRRSEAKEGATP